MSLLFGGPYPIMLLRKRTRGLEKFRISQSFTKRVFRADFCKSKTFNVHKSRKNDFWEFKKISCLFAKKKIFAKKKKNLLFDFDTIFFFFFWKVKKSTFFLRFFGGFFRHGIAASGRGIARIKNRMYTYITYILLRIF